MYEFDGIKPQALFLLADNKFNDSKPFYEEHKAEINRLAVKPMRQIGVLLSEDMASLDDKMVLNPVRMVSRIRRDTRFSKNKALYRDNIWIMFMRSKQDYKYLPCMWFEVTQQYYSSGIAFFRSIPFLMDIYRKEISEHPDEFEKAVKSAEKAGYVFSADSYAREKPGICPEKLKGYYNAKDCFFIKRSKDFEVIGDDRIIDELKRGFKALSPLYKFLLRASERAEQEENYGSR